MSKVEREAVILNTVPGSKWYQCVNSKWVVGLVERVTKTTIYLEGGTRISKRNCRDQDGWAWYPPTQNIVKQFEDFEVARVAYEAAVEKLREAAQRATPAQLLKLATQLESLIDLSEIH